VKAAGIITDRRPKDVLLNVLVERGVDLLFPLR
jgi:hypothetical protein